MPVFLQNRHGNRSHLIPAHGIPDVSHVFGLNTNRGGAVGVGSNRIRAYDDTPCAFRRIINVIQPPACGLVIFNILKASSTVRSILTNLLRSAILGCISV